MYKELVIYVLTGALAKVKPKKPMDRYYEIYGQPVAKGRPRITTTGGFARAYTPKKTREYEEKIKWLIPREEPLCADPVELHIRFYEKMPKSFSKKRQLKALTGHVRPQVRPDIDNYVKCVLDALNGHIYVDDKQVCKLIAERFYTDNPRTVICLRSI